MGVDSPVRNKDRNDGREPTVSIVIPAKNEARNLELVLPQLPLVHQVVVVDGHSVDDTIAVARSVRAGVEVVQQTRRGKGNALACGFAAATGDIVVMFDADGSADSAEIPRFVETLRNGADVAKGSRFAPGGGSEDITLVRRLGNASLSTLANTLLRTSYSDMCYGYNAFWRHLVPQLNLPDPDIGRGDEMLWGDGFEIETVLTCRFALLGARVVEVPSVERLRIHGVSNLNAVTDGMRVLRTVLHECRGGRNRRSRRSSREVETRGIDAFDSAA